MRARGIKPGFFKNDSLGTLPPLVRILFCGLWCMADRDGKLEDRPQRIKVEILPYDDCDIDSFLALLEQNGFIIRYAVQSRKYLKINKFSEHQNPHKQEKDSVIPEPSTSKIGVSSDEKRNLFESESEVVGLTPDSGLLTPDCGEPAPGNFPEKPEEIVSKELTVASHFEKKYVDTVKRPVLLGSDFVRGMREAVRVHGRQAILEAIGRFFTTQDPWIVQRGYPPSIFLKQLTTWVAGTGPPAEGTQRIDDLVAKAFQEEIHGRPG